MRKHHKILGRVICKQMECNAAHMVELKPFDLSLSPKTPVNLVSPETMHGRPSSLREAAKPPSVARTVSRLKVYLSAEIACTAAENTV